MICLHFHKPAEAVFAWRYEPSGYHEIMIDPPPMENVRTMSSTRHSRNILLSFPPASRFQTELRRAQTANYVAAYVISTCKRGYWFWVSYEEWPCVLNDRITFFKAWHASLWNVFWSIVKLLFIHVIDIKYGCKLYGIISHSNWMNGNVNCDKVHGSHEMKT